VADAAAVARLGGDFHRQVHQALALGNAHREKLGLLARDEQAPQLQRLDPMAQVGAVGLLVQAQGVVEGGEVGGPDAHHVFAGVFLGFVLFVFHAGSRAGLEEG